MVLSPSNHSLETITLKQLQLGMYVVEIIDTSDIKIKSEGYITNQESINQLKKARIVTVTVDPSKQKSADKIDRVFADIQTIAKKEQKAPKSPIASLDHEISKANKVYNSAQELQGKILESVRLERALKIENITQTTNDMVDSVFRNPDALSCLARIQSADSFLLEHSLNVPILLAVFANYLGFEKRLIKEITLGAFLHDIGQAILPKELLNKSDDLTEKEEKILKSHVALGLKLLEDCPDISHIAMRMVREHHERLDGSGYPQGLKEEEISKYGKMLAIIDSYDAITCERPYKKSMYPISAFKALVADSPKLFDKELVEKFIQCIGLYPVGTLVKLKSGKIGIISKLNKNKPLQPYVRVFYNTRLGQAIPIEEINLIKPKYDDHIDCCITPEEFNINLIGFFKTAFID